MLLFYFDPLIILRSGNEFLFGLLIDLWAFRLILKFDMLLSFLNKSKLSY